VGAVRRYVFSALLISMIAGGSTCINPVHDRDRKPRLLITADTTVSVKDTLLLHARTWTEGAQAVTFKWRVNGRTASPDSDSVCVLFFGIADTGRHSIAVTGYSELGVSSDPETVHVTVLLNPPTLHMLTSDTTIFANDSLVIRAAASDKNGFVARCLWSIDSAGYTVATDSAWCTVGWGERGGSHVVRVRAMDDDSIMSPAESVLVTVRLTPPAIRAMRDTATAVNDTLGIFAARTDTFSTTVRYVWAKNGRDFSDTTNTGSFPAVFGRLVAGKRQVLVKAVDNHHLESNVDTIQVTVHLYAPRLSIIHDTAVAINDTITLHATASDTNGSVVSYVWAPAGKAFLDTTKTGSIQLRFTRADTGTHRIKVMAIDDDTLLSNIDSVNLVVRMKPPPMVRCMGDTAVFVNDTVVVHAAGTVSGSKSPIVAYVWARDGGAFIDTTATGSLALRFTRNDGGSHTIKVKVVDRDTMESLADSVIISVTLGAPKVRAMKDTVVFINDTAMLHAAGTDTNGRVTEYVWSLDGGAYRDTSVIGVFATVWGRAGAGTHRVKVKVIDDDTVESLPDSLTVTVTVGAPKVAAMKDTVVFINDTAVLHATGTDTNGRVVSYLWALNGAAFTDTTATGVLKAVWGRTGAGTHRVKVVAVDDDTLLSPPDSMNVTVRLGMPFVKHTRDTSVVRGDTVVMTISASDTNGTIKKYYWDMSGKGWSDSSDSPSRPITSGIHTVLRVVAGARDDDGNIATDTFSISFSAVACSVTVSRPLWRDTLYMYSVDLPLGKAAFSYLARRKDAVADSFTYTITCGKSVAELVTRYSGKDTVCTVPAFDTGKSYFRLIAVSSHNDSVQVLDSVFSVWQRQVCFIGHSIVTGLLGTPDSGGFRRIVIDTLRSLSPSKKQLRIVGPLISHVLQPPEDDSSLAETGRKCVDIFDSLFNHPSLAADAWVYMMGANDQYSYFGWYYTVATIDFMHARNPQGEIFVLNALPLPHDTVDAVYTIDSLFRADLATFNRMLDSAVTVRRQSWQSRQEGGAWMVDVYAPMALLPDSAYNPVYFSDFIHPNQKGYTLMGNRIVQTIKANTKIFK
jgi:hypothetical protein